MTYVSIGASAAGKRIHEAGLAYEKGKRRRQKDTINAIIARTAAIQEALDDRAAAATPAPPAAAPDPSPHDWGPDIKRIIREVSAVTGVSMLDLVSDRRSKWISPARHAAMYEARMKTGASLRRIGNAIGGRDYSTVIYGIRAHCKRTGDPMPVGMYPEGTPQRKQRRRDSVWCPPIHNKEQNNG